MAERPLSAWEQIRDHYFPRGNVDQMLALRKHLYQEICAVQETRSNHPPGFLDKGDLLRARAIAASLFILMLEKTDAAEMLHPYIDAKQYPKNVFVADKNIEELERIAPDRPQDTVAACSIMTQVASLRYRSFQRDHKVGLALTQRAEALFASNEAYYNKENPSRELRLRFLLARHENLLHRSLFQWSDGQMSEARECLEKSLNTLTIEYEKCLAGSQNVPLAGSIEVLLTQILGSLAEKLWVEEPGTGWPRARIYRSLQTTPVQIIPAPIGKPTFKQIPGRSIDTCRRGYAFILASRIEGDDTTTNSRLSIALAKDAERCFIELANTLGERHAWLVRARTQRLRCYIQAGKNKPAESLYRELVNEVEELKDKDQEEYDFAKGSLSLTRTWMLERKAAVASPDQREEEWRACLAEAQQIIQSERIPGRLERDGLLHQGRAWLNWAICLRRKRNIEEKRLSSKYEKEGRALIQKAIKLARDRHRPKIIAAGNLFLAEGLMETDPSAAAEALREAERLLAQAKNTYLEEKLRELQATPIIQEDGFVTLSLNMVPYDEMLEPALLAACIDYHRREVEKRGGNNSKKIRERIAQRMGMHVKTLERKLEKIREWRRILPDEEASQDHDGKSETKKQKRKKRA